MSRGSCECDYAAADASQEAVASDSEGAIGLVSPVKARRKKCVRKSQRLKWISKPSLSIEVMNVR